MELPKRTYTLDEASQELHISRETLERLLPNLPSGSHREGDDISEETLNHIMDMMNDPNFTPEAA